MDSESQTTSGIFPPADDPPTEPEPRELESGMMLAGRFRLLRKLGEGGQATVWQADDVRLGQQVAVKILPAHLAANPDRRRQLIDEVKTARKVTHPNVCRVHDIVASTDGDLVAMEYVEGGDLAQELARIGKLPWEKAVDVMRQVASGLGAIHAGGIIHRDLKPGNILFDHAGTARISDFGLALAARSIEGHGARAGTVPYMSPEQRTGKSVTTRSDVYTLALILYQCLTGDLPPSTVDLEGRADADVLAGSLRPHLPNFDLARRFGRLLARCLPASPDDRLSVVEFEQELATIADDDDASGLSKITQRLRTRIKLAAFSHPKLTAVIISVPLAIALAWLFSPLFHPRTALPNAWLHRQIAAHRPALFAGDSFQHVIITGVTSNEEVAELATSLEIPEMSVFDPRSLRRMHGKVATIFSKNSPAALVWDIYFEGESAHDQELALGFKALRSAGITPVVGASKWLLDETSAPAMSSTLWNAGPLWGCVHLTQLDDGMFSVPLALIRGDDAPMPSLALSAYIAARRPSAGASITPDKPQSVICIDYWKPHPSRPGERIDLTPDDAIPVTAFQPFEPIPGDFSERNHVMIGDVYCEYPFSMPPRDVTDASTIPLSELLAMNAAQRTDLLRDKVVLIADLRPGIDMASLRLPIDGESLVRGARLQAGLIESLLHQVGQTRLAPPFHVLLLIGSATIGGLIAISVPALLPHALRRRHCGLRWLAGSPIRWAICAVFAACVLWWTITLGADRATVVEPFVPILAGILACEIATILLLCASHRTTNKGSVSQQ